MEAENYDDENYQNYVRINIMLDNRDNFYIR